jgi:serine/threonine-protein kinase
MSPELVQRPETADTRADVWSLGIVLAELLIGYPPRVSEDPTLGLAAAVNEDLRDHAPAGLQEVIVRCLQNDASRRYADVIELADALQEYVPHGGAAVARILAIVRSVRKGSLAGEGSMLDSGRSPPVCGPTLESPRVRVEIRDGGRHVAAGWDHSRAALGRSRWAVASIGIAVLLGGAAILRTYLAHAPKAHRLVASSAASADGSSTVAWSVVPSGRDSELSRDQDAAIDLAATETPSATQKSGSSQAGLVEDRRRLGVDARRKSSVQGTTERPAAGPPRGAPGAPPKSQVLGAPAVDGELDPLDGRF